MSPILWCRKVTGMPVVYLMEWDIPKDEERSEKRRKWFREVMMPNWEKIVEEKGIKFKGGSWSDNTGHTIWWNRFETMEDFAKAWDDERWQQMSARWAYFVDNLRIRLLRPSVTIPEDMW